MCTWVEHTRRHCELKAAGDDHGDDDDDGDDSGDDDDDDDDDDLEHLISVS